MQAIMDYNAGRYAQHYSDIAVVADLVEAARQRGYSHDISQTYPEAAGVTCFVDKPGLGATAALSIAMPAAQMTEDTAGTIAAIIREEISRC